jgi:hypothetical protein
MCRSPGVLIPLPVARADKARQGSTPQVNVHIWSGLAETISSASKVRSKVINLIIDR